jgi:uncharacterized membrane protein YeaQ/YmgE (transglycosylase-associated protein family)
MSIVWMLFIGLLAGALARLIMRHKEPGGIGVTLLLGLAGSFLAGFLGRAVGWYHEGRGAGLIGSIVGAMILLGIYRLAIGHGLGGHGGRFERHTPA